MDVPLIRNFGGWEKEKERCGRKEIKRVPVKSIIKRYVLLPSSVTDAWKEIQLL